MMDPEYYLGAVRGADGSWSTTKYCDAALDAPVAERDMKVPYCRAASRPRQAVIMSGPPAP